MIDDISKYQQRIEELERENLFYKEKSEYYELLINKTNSWEIFRDHQGILKYVSPSIKNIVGYTKDEYINELKFEDIIFPEDFESAKSVYEKQLNREPINNFIFRVVHKNRNIKYVSLSSRPVYNKNNEYLGFRTSITDITELKNAEKAEKDTNELLSLFIKYSPIHAYIKEVTPDVSKVLFASENYIDMIGIKGSDMVGKTMEELFPLEFAKKITSDDWEVVKNEHILKLDEELNNRYYTTIKFPIIQGNRKLLAGYTIEITDRKKSEIIISQQNVELQKLNYDKDRFISILAHDLKNPFNIILGFLEVLSDNVYNYDIKTIEEHISYVKNSAKQVFELLEDTLTWITAQSGKLPFEPQNIELNSLISEIIDSFEPYFNSKEIIIKNNLIDRIFVFADVYMLKTILRNLISNAIKFTNSGGIVEILIQYLENETQISIIDNGVGISVEKQKKLFDISQFKSTTGTAGEVGTGIGLLLCKEFIDKHKGNIFVSSEIGKGSKFTFSLPHSI